MIMEIEDVIFVKEAVINTPDPIDLSMKILEKAMSYGEVIEKRSTFETDGPLKKSAMEFDVIRRFDDYSQFRISLLLNGEMNHRAFLEISLSGSVRTRIEEEGFFSTVFSEFYLENLYQRTTRHAKEELVKAGKDLEKNIATIRHK